MKLTWKAALLVALGACDSCHDREDAIPIYAQSQHQGAEAAERLKRQQVADRLMALKSNTIAAIRTNKKYLAEWGAQIAAAAQASVRESYQTNAHGVSFDVPVGTYSGVGTINAHVHEQYNSQGERIDAGAVPTYASPMRSSGVRGWALEPVGVLMRELAVTSAGVVSSVDDSLDPPVINWMTECQVAFRFEVIGEHGAEGFRKEENAATTCRFVVVDAKLEGAIDINRGESACYKALHRCDDQLARSYGTYRSTDSMTVLAIDGESRATVTTADGSTTTYERLPSSSAYVDKLVPGATLPFLVPGPKGAWLPTSTVDRHGQRTAFEYAGPSGSLSAVIAPQGRRTEYRRGAELRIEEIAMPGPAGSEQVYRLSWEARSWVPGWSSHARPDPYTTLVGLQLPDGRAYAFDYEPSGLLRKATLPDGSVHEYRYTEDPRHGIAPIYNTNFGLDHVFPTQELVAPLGEGGPTFTFEHTTYVDPATRTVWEHVTQPDGSVRRTQRRQPDGCTLDIVGPLVEEVWAGGTLGQGPNPTWAGEGLLERHTYQYEGTARVDSPDCRSFADERVVAITHERDGVTWTERFEHQPHPAAPGRITSNVTRHVIGGGGRQRETVTEYVDAPAYSARNLLSLIRAQRALGDTYEAGRLVQRVLDRVEYGHDELPLVASGAPGLVDRGPVRGNVTSITRYGAPGSAGAPVTTRTAYFDTGNVAKEWSGRAVATGSLADASARRNTFDVQHCGPSHTTSVSTVTLPAPGNGAVHATSTVTDCATGLVLASRGVNGEWTCTQYDLAGRVVEVARPGDLLSALPAGVRDRDPARCPTTSATELGSGGRGPTTWIEYLDMDRAGLARTVVHEKTGSPAGRVTVIWRDGLDREIANCASVDLATVASTAAGSLAEAAGSGTPYSCVWRSFDHANRLTQATVNVFQAELPGSAERPALPVRGTTIAYDGLGRVLRRTTAAGRTTTFAYGGANGRFVTTMIPPGEGRSTVTETSVLGHVELVAEASPDCGSAACTTEFHVDALGRVVDAIEPGGITTTSEYDGFGRIVTFRDPDRGTITSAYDENGNKRRETDARGTITWEYDALDRVLAKRYSTGRAEEAEVAFHYDGRAPGLPAAITATGSSQVGVLTLERNGLVARWHGVDRRGREVVAITELDDGSAWSVETTYGYADGTPHPAGPLVVARSVPHDGAVDEQLAYAYDGTGLLAAISGRAGAIVTDLRRNAAGELVEYRYGNRTHTVRAFGDDGDLQQIVVRDGDDAVISALEMIRDEAGNIRELHDYVPLEARTGCAPGADGCRPGPLSATFTYDTRNQLRSMTSGGATRTWTYDGLRNLTRIEQTGEGAFVRSFGYGGTNRDGTARPPHAVGSVQDGATQATYHYDATGNLAHALGRPGGDLRVTWNLDNMPVEVTRGDATVARKHFLGERLWKKVVPTADGDRTTYYLDGARLEQLGSAAPVLHVQYETYAEREGTTVRYFHADQLNSTALVTDADGDVIFREATWAYGETRALVGDEAPHPRFNGKELEEETQLVDFGARLYDPYLGRWWSADDDTRDGLNRYTFVGNNPINAFDPDGHQKKKRQTDSERTNQQQQTAATNTPTPQSGPAQGQLVIRVVEPVPGPYAPGQAPKVGVEYRFTCGGSGSGQVLCWTNKPVNIPGQGEVIAARITFDGSGRAVLQYVAPAPKLDVPAAVELGGSAGFVTFGVSEITAGPDAGKRALKLGLQLRPGASIGVDPNADGKSALTLTASVPGAKVDIFKNPRFGDAEFFTPGANYSAAVENGKLKAPTSLRDWIPNLELSVTIGPDFFRDNGVKPTNPRGSLNCVRTGNYGCR